MKKYSLSGNIDIANGLGSLTNDGVYAAMSVLFFLVSVALVAIVFLIHWHKLVPFAGVLLYGFLTIRLDDATIMDFLKYAVRYFISTQQEYEWR